MPKPSKGSFSCFVQLSRLEQYSDIVRSGVVRLYLHKFLAEKLGVSDSLVWRWVSKDDSMPVQGVYLMADAYVEFARTLIDAASALRQQATIAIAEERERLQLLDESTAAPPPQPLPPSTTQPAAPAAASGTVRPVSGALVFGTPVRPPIL